MGNVRAGQRAARVEEPGGHPEDLSWALKMCRHQTEARRQRGGSISGKGRKACLSLLSRSQGPGAEKTTKGISAFWDHRSQEDQSCQTSSYSHVGPELWQISTVHRLPWRVSSFIK